MLLKIIGVALIGVTLVLVLKNYKSDFTIIISVATGLIIFFILLESLKQVLNSFFSLSSSVGISEEILSLLLKIIGVGYLIEFAVDIASDSGCTSIANKVSLAGKVIVLAMVIPLITEIFSNIVSLL